jgi:hypothetical protein
MIRARPGRPFSRLCSGEVLWISYPVAKLTRKMRGDFEEFLVEIPLLLEDLQGLPDGESLAQARALG